MDFFKKLKAKIEGQDRKKLIENTVIVIIIGIVLLIAGSTLFHGKEAAGAGNEKEAAARAASPDSSPTAGDDAESRLKALLSQMKDVGKVDVMITYAVSKEDVPAYDVKRSQSSTQEKDSEGGTRNVSEEQYDSTVAYEDSADGGKKPVLLKKIEPQVKGVLVVAEGADSAEVRESIRSSVMVVLDVPAHKVQVVQRKK
jgi:stage III sporulation protein AG